MLSVPHFSFPLRVGGNDFVEVEQDTVDEVTQSIRILLDTTQGERVELPDYGIDPLFKTTMDLAEVRQAIETWEPRASVLLDQEVDPTDVLTRLLTVKVKHT